MNWFLIIMFFLCGVLLIPISIFYLIKKIKVVKGGIQFEATVVDFLKYECKGAKRYKCIFKFSYQNEILRLPCLQTRKFKCKVGIKKIIYYNPNIPDVVSIKGNYATEFTAIALFLLAIAFFFAGINEMNGLRGFH